MKIRPQMFLSLTAVGCAAVAGLHFATAEQPTQRQGTQKIQRPDTPDNAQQQQRDVRSRTDNRKRTDGRQRTTVRSQTNTVIRSSVFIGAPVSISGGTALGTIQEVVFTDGGCVDYVIVNYDNRLVPVPWMAGTFRADDRAFLLTVEENQLAQLPTFTDYAQLSDATFVAQVNTFFKIDNRTRDRRDDKSRRDGKSDKAGDGKAPTEADGKQPADSNEATPRTEKKAESPAGDQNRGSKNAQPKSAEPKPAQPKKESEKPAEK